MQFELGKMWLQLHVTYKFIIITLGAPEIYFAQIRTELFAQYALKLAQYNR